MQERSTAELYKCYFPTETLKSQFTQPGKMSKVQEAYTKEAFIQLF